MVDPNKLLAEIRELQAVTPYKEDRFDNLEAMAHKIKQLDEALSSGMFFPDDWCRTKIKGEDS